MFGLPPAAKSIQLLTAPLHHQGMNDLYNYQHAMKQHIHKCDSTLHQIHTTLSQSSTLITKRDHRRNLHPGIYKNKGTEARCKQTKAQSGVQR